MEKYGLIGHPLGHSFSKNYFNEKFQNEGIDAEYVNFDIPAIDDLIEIVATNQNLKGLNVTIPYKEQILSKLNSLSDEAKEIGAVNVVKIDYKGHTPVLRGYNSDVVGFMRSIEPLIETHHQKALVLGTGGAAKAVKYGLRKLGLDVVMVSRSKREGMITYSELTPDMMSEYMVIVNCTPLGMYPHTEECPAIPYEALTPKHLLYDLIYNPDETMFLRKGREQGALTKNGLEMLLLQAFVSWEIWHKTIY